MDETTAAPQRTGERLERVENLVSDLVAVMSQGEASPPEWDVAMKLLVNRLDEVERRCRLVDESLAEFTDWRVAHEEAARWIVTWIESIELNREAELRQHTGQIQKFLREIWGADRELRPRTAAGDP